MPPRRRVAGRDGRAADRGRQPRRGPGAAVDRRDGAGRRAAPRCRRAGRTLRGYLARRQRARRLCRAHQPAAGRRQGPVEAITGRTAPGARPPRHRGRSGRRAPVGVPPGRLQRLVAPRRRPHLAVLRRLHRLGRRRWRSSCPRGSTCSRTARSARPRRRSIWCGRRSTPPAPDGDEVVDAFRRVLADHRNPEGEERPNAANCVHLETFGTRSSCIVRVPSGTGRAAPVGGRRPALHHRLRGRGGLWELPLASPRRLSRGRAACSAGGAAGRRRRRDACGDPPRSR